MIVEEAIRYLHHEARRCRDRDTAESLCLLLPAILQRLGLKPMDDVEAFCFLLEMRAELREQQNAQQVLAH
jgi:hypothetical protein